VHSQASLPNLDHLSLALIIAKENAFLPTGIHKLELAVKDQPKKCGEFTNVYQEDVFVDDQNIHIPIADHHRHQASQM